MISKEIPYQEPIKIAEKLQQEDFACLLGAKFEQDAPQNTNNHSFIAISPWAKLLCINGKSYLNNQQDKRSIEQIMQDFQKQFSLKTNKDLPPFQGGWIGAWHYSHAKVLHNLATYPTKNKITGSWLLFDLVISFDNKNKKTFLISTGYPETDSAKRAQHAKNRLVFLEKKLKTQENKSEKQNWQLNKSTKKADFLKKIQLAKEAIKRGDLFEVNITQKFSKKLVNEDPWEMFKQLWQQNPAPFASFFTTKDYSIMSCSPERFLKVTNNQASSRPIKGTTSIGKTPEKTASKAKNLRFCQKQIAENTMIVDLVRNDLSKICQPHSVIVKEYCKIEKYGNVQHLVSEIIGSLLPNKNSLDAFIALFPAGSITGAPKEQAMKCIQQIEQYDRDLYCGSLGYLSHCCNMDSCVLIRTVVAKKNQLYTNAGGAILLNSDPISEYQEALLKSTKLTKAIYE